LLRLAANTWPPASYNPAFSFAVVRDFPACAHFLSARGAVFRYSDGVIRELQEPWALDRVAAIAEKYPDVAKIEHELWSDPSVSLAVIERPSASAALIELMVGHLRGGHVPREFLEGWLLRNRGRLPNLISLSSPNSDRFVALCRALNPRAEIIFAGGEILRCDVISSLEFVVGDDWSRARNFFKILEEAGGTQNEVLSLFMAGLLHGAPIVSDSYAGSTSRYYPAVAIASRAGFGVTYLRRLVAEGVDFTKHEFCAGCLLGSRRCKLWRVSCPSDDVCAALERLGAVRASHGG
jgi:hypothetical protein